MKKLTYILLFVCSVVVGQKDTHLDDFIFDGWDMAISLYDVPIPTDFQNLYYVNPDAAIDGDGLTIVTASQDLPATLVSNTAYLFKSGTDLIQNVSYKFITNDSVYFGAYDTGVRPSIRLTGDSQPYKVNGTHWYSVGILWYSRLDYDDVDTVLVYDCEFDGQFLPSTSDILVLWGKNIKVIGCILHDLPQEGIYVNGENNNGENVEIGWDHIYDINQSWEPPSTDHTIAHGDCIQFTSSDNFYIHHTVADKSTVGNKFCIIIRDETHDVVSYSGLIEYNVCYAPLETVEGGAAVYFEDPQNTVFRNNKVVSTSDNTAQSGIYIGSEDNLTLELYGNLIIEGNFGIGPSDLTQHTITGFNNTISRVGGSSAGTWDYNVNNIHQKHTSGQSSTNLAIDSVGESTLFVNADTLDYRLKEESPAIETGTYNATYMSEYNYDVDSTVVPHDATISSGSYQLDAIIEASPPSSITNYWPLRINSNDSIGLLDGTDTDIAYSNEWADFTGISSQIAITEINLSDATEWMLSFWIDPPTTFKNLFGKDANNDLLYRDNKISLECSSNYHEFTPTVTINEPHMITLSAKTNRNVVMYLDTVAVDSFTYTSTAFDFAFFGYNPGNDARYDGLMKLVRLGDQHYFESDVYSMYFNFPSAFTLDTVNVFTVVNRREIHTIFNAALIEYSQTNDTIVSGVAGVKGECDKTNVFIKEVPETATDTMNYNIDTFYDRIKKFNVAVNFANE